MAWKEMERLEKEDGHETEELGFPTKCENSVGEGRKAEADDDDSGIDVLNIFHFPLQDSLQFPSRNCDLNVKLGDGPCLQLQLFKLVAFNNKCTAEYPRQQHGECGQQRQIPSGSVGPGCQLGKS